jgi:hypothetical protein
MLKLESEADLDRLISEGITESLTLDYKGSLALAKDSKNGRPGARTSVRRNRSPVRIGRHRPFLNTMSDPSDSHQKRQADGFVEPWS